MGWCTHPTNRFQRIIIPYHSLHGAQDGNLVKIDAEQIQGNFIGKVTAILRSRPEPVDELDELSAVFESSVNLSRLSKPALLKSDDSTANTLDSDNFTEYSPGTFHLSNYLPPVIITLGSHTWRCGLGYDIEDDGISSIPSMVEPNVIGRPIFSVAQVN